MFPTLRVLPTGSSRTTFIRTLQRGYATRKSFNDRVRDRVEARPFVYFGLPFLSLIVAGSFILSEFTATRYELHEKKTHKLNREDELGLERGRRRLNLQEEYWRLLDKEGGMGADDEWEVKRVPRP
ncbi:MAG: cytochrome c oxidase assembly protein COX16-domain-containing protein [Piptocephalis tieghemiana]|nr:MAG: cytochrome c oxidase assembly protein COX16-domain-containing protein [Piptocephalis tieghemiana]